MRRAADAHGAVLDAPPLADALAHDPLLRPLKLVAMPSDDSLLPRWVLCAGCWVLLGNRAGCLACCPWS